MVMDCVSQERKASIYVHLNTELGLLCTCMWIQHILLARKFVTADLQEIENDTKKKKSKYHQSIDVSK